MAKRFEGKVCLITGAASGIGRATAEKMAALGAQLALADINLEGLTETNERCGGSHLFQSFDVGVSRACNDFITATLSRFNRLDHVFNCAGVNPTAYALTDTTDEYFDKLTNTNLRGTYNITRAAIPHLPPGSAIVNVSSVMGLTVTAEYAIYCATKWAIVGFTKAMAMELGSKQIRVNAVAPGYIDTPTNAGVLAGEAEVAKQKGKIAMGRMGTADEVADVVAFLFRYVILLALRREINDPDSRHRSDDARYMSGSIVEISGGRT
ncbi:short-chain dehydrogenase like protein [Teratosphaeria destructans]|uniref:Short-chain dehydrogenase like protein n=1 Tax=Teratosphaeria destructans TaxID=418781 RepID=A0A9W7SYL8_9PEZI|nr:short-chain dehydrogenase like protein [Teratosphaeria destructans]